MKAQIALYGAQLADWSLAIPEFNSSSQGVANFCIFTILLLKK